MTEFVIRASSLKSAKGHSVSTERYILKFVFFVVFFVILRNGRSVETELRFLTKMLVRGSSPAGSNFTKIREKSRKSRSEEHVGRHCAHGAAQEVPQDPLQP